MLLALLLCPFALPCSVYGPLFDQNKLCHFWHRAQTSQNRRHLHVHLPAHLSFGKMRPDAWTTTTAHKQLLFAIGQSVARSAFLTWPSCHLAISATNILAGAETAGRTHALRLSAAVSCSLVVLTISNRSGSRMNPSCTRRLCVCTDICYVLEQQYRHGLLAGVQECSWTLILNFEKSGCVQVEAIKSGVQPGLTMVVGPPGTGKTDTAVQIMHVLYHNCPGQRTLLITHSNQVSLWQHWPTFDLSWRLRKQISLPLALTQSPGFLGPIAVYRVKQS